MLDHWAEALASPHSVAPPPPEEAASIQMVVRERLPVFEAICPQRSVTTRKEIKRLTGWEMWEMLYPASALVDRGGGQWYPTGRTTDSPGSYHWEMYFGMASVTAYAACACGCAQTLAVVSVRFPELNVGDEVECAVAPNRQVHPRVASELLERISVEVVSRASAKKQEIRKEIRNNIAIYLAQQRKANKANKGGGKQRK